MAHLGAEIGLAAVFTLITLFMPTDLIKKGQEPQIATYFKAGMPNADSAKDHTEGYNKQSYGGSVPTVAYFGANGDRVGFWRNDGGKHKIEHDGFAQVGANYFDGNVRTAEYMTVTASGFDAVCISLVQVTHPGLQETYSYLPGEIAAVCGEFFMNRTKTGDKNAETVSKMYQWSESMTLVQFQEEGMNREERPKCLWIDSSDEHGEVATPAKGWSVHLPDFQKSNATYDIWLEDPGQMCDFSSRFQPYKRINEYMCPEIFETPPKTGEILGFGFKERPACLPNLYLAPGEELQEDICKDKRIPKKERQDVARKFGKQGECVKIKDFNGGDWTFGPIDHKRAKRQQESQHPKQFNQRRSSSKSTRQPKKRFQDRFAGQLVKSRDSRQSARGLCTSENSVGPSWYSYHEKRFCDMQKRKLYPACETDSETETECFDLKLNETRHTFEKRGETVKHTHVTDIE